MKKLIIPFFWVLNIIQLPVYSQSQDLEKIAREYFNGVKLTTEQNKNLWNINLNGPMILIDPFTRKIYASEQDSLGTLTYNNSIYTGTFPKSINISGAWVEWNGKVWAMLPFPFPEGTTIKDGVGYLCHELFHRAQKKLGFVFPNEELSNHLDTKEGRIFLRLEIEALRKAIESENREEMENHLKNAVIFRSYRYVLYPESKRKENLLELNEGITQYTTVILQSLSKEETVAYFKKVSDIFINGSTYVRTFAYHTIPAYGYLLRPQNKYWNQQISLQTNLTDFFIKEFGINLPENIKEEVEKIRNDYNGKKIFEEEEAREKKLLIEKKQFIQTLISDPHLEIEIRGNKMSFDPSNVIPLEGKGTVYNGTVRWSDKWGILEVRNGLFLDENDSKICVTFPKEVVNKYAKGNDWELWLNEGYQFVKNDTNGNYTVEKSE